MWHSIKEATRIKNKDAKIIRYKDPRSCKDKEFKFCLNFRTFKVIVILHIMHFIHKITSDIFERALNGFAISYI